MVPLDNLAVDIRDEEKSGEDSQAKASAERDTCDVPGGHLVEAESWRALVHDRQRADGSGDEEENRGGVDGPGKRVLPHVNGHLDQHEDDSSKARGDERSHAQAGKDGAKPRASAPTPLDLACANSGNTNTGDGGNEGVCR